MEDKSESRLTRPRKWAIGLAVAYALLAAVLGLIVPRLAREPLRALLDDTVPARVELAELSLNPFTLEIGVRGLALRDEEGGDIVRLEHARIDLEGWACLLGVVEIDSVRLEGLEIDVAVEESGRVNLLALVPHDDPDERDDSEGDAGLFPVRVGELEIVAGRVGLVDHTRPTPFGIEIDPVDIDLFDFSTVPDERGRLRLAASSPGGLRLSTEFEIALHPLAVAGEIGIEGIDHGLLAGYLGPDADVRPRSGSIAAEAAFRIQVAPGDIVVRIDEGRVRAEDWHFESDLARLSTVELASFTVDGFELGLVEQTVTVREVALGGPRVSVVRIAGASSPAAEPEADGEQEDPGARAEAGGAGGGSGGAPDASEPMHDRTADHWVIRIDRFSIADGHLTVADAEARGRSIFEAGPIELEALDLGNEPGRTARIDSKVHFPSAPGAEFGAGAPPQLLLRGELSGAPVSAKLDLELDALPLAPLAPLLGLAPDVRIEAGALSAATHFEGSWPESAPPDFSLRSDLTLRGLSVLQDVGESAAGASGQRVLGLDLIEVEGAEATESGHRVSVGRVRVVAPYVRVDRRADGSLNLSRLRDPARAREPADAEVRSAPELRVGRVTFEDGVIAYRDATPARAFAVDVEQISGSIERSGGEPAGTISIRGSVDGSAPIEIDGTFADSKEISAQLRLTGMNAIRLGPYFEQYLGNEVEQGKLSLDLDYRLDHERLRGSNAVRFDQLIFGPRTSSPDALNLPIPLAFKLMTDPRGRARLELDIAGDLDDPGFSLRSLITAAFVKVIRQTLSSPIAVLQTAMPDLTANTELRFGFEPGKAGLDLELETQLASLASVLADEPKLGVRIKGRVDPDLDGAALAAAAGAEAASEEALRELGQARARAIRDELVLRGGVDAGRVFVRSIDMQGLADAGRVAVDVTLSDD